MLPLNICPQQAEIEIEQVGLGKEDEDVGEVAQHLGYSQITRGSHLLCV